MSHASDCPRCGSAAHVVRRSPVSGCWTQSLCGSCFYTWRSSEPAYATDGARYAEAFKIKPEDIPNMKPVPAIPPRRA